MSAADVAEEVRRQREAFFAGHRAVSSAGKNLVVTTIILPCFA